MLGGLFPVVLTAGPFGLMVTGVPARATALAILALC
jgi:hypothetical protein